MTRSTGVVRALGDLVLMSKAKAVNFSGLPMFDCAAGAATARTTPRSATRVLRIDRPPLPGRLQPSAHLTWGIIPLATCPAHAGRAVDRHPEGGAAGGLAVRVRDTYVDAFRSGSGHPS